MSLNVPILQDQHRVCVYTLITFHALYNNTSHLGAPASVPSSSYQSKPYLVSKYRSVVALAYT